MEEQIKHEPSVASSGEGQFKVHYHLRDGMHQMDALTRNKAEAETLALLLEVGSIVGVQLQLETRAYGEGGLQEFWQLIGQNKEQIALISSLVTALLAAPFYRSKLTQSKQQTELNTLNIKKLKLEIKERERAAEAAESKASSPKNLALELEDAPAVLEYARALLSSQKVARRRSNFYRQLISDSKVEAIGFAPSHSPVEELLVKRERFNDYVIDRLDLDPLNYRDVPIEVVSPVLRPQALKWRGIFSKRVISFELEDRQFRADVDAKRIQFQNGTILICDLLALQKEDEVGEVEISGFVVTKVHRVIEPTGHHEVETDSNTQGLLGLGEE